MQNPVVNVNGEITRNAAQISVFDRGFLYGDSLYEVVRTYQGEFFGLDEHLARLEASAALAHMTLSQTAAEYRAQILRTYAAFAQTTHQKSPEAYMRLIVTRGVGTIGFGLSCIRTPTQYVIIVQPLDPPTEAQYQKGLHLQVSERLRNDPRALSPAMKSGNYLNSLLAYLEATHVDSKNHYDDALLCNSDGHLTEGTTFNIFYIKRGIIATPPLDIGILDGITRRHVIEIARQAGLEVRQVRFPRERLYEADEVFISSSIKEVFAVTKIDGRPIARGKPGPITEKLRRSYSNSIGRAVGAAG